MDDAVSNHYSRPHQSGGFYKKMGVKQGYAIPIIRQQVDPYLEHTTGEEGTTEANDYGRLAKQTRKVQHLKKRKKYGGRSSSSSSYSDSEDEGEKKRRINNKYKEKRKEKKKKNKRKRSRIDEALGSDTY